MFHCMFDEIMPLLFVFQVIDGVTLTNLDIVDLGSERGQEGTLSQQLDRCTTPFGETSSFARKVFLIL